MGWNGSRFEGTMGLVRDGMEMGFLSLVCALQKDRISRCGVRKILSLRWECLVCSVGARAAVRTGCARGALR